MRKIFNPYTNRMVRSGGKVGKSIRKQMGGNIGHDTCIAVNNLHYGVTSGDIHDINDIDGPPPPRILLRACAVELKEDGCGLSCQRCSGMFERGGLPSKLQRLKAGIPALSFSNAVNYDIRQVLDGDVILSPLQLRILRRYANNRERLMLLNLEMEQFEPDTPMFNALYQEQLRVGEILDAQ